MIKLTCTNGHEFLIDPPTYPKEVIAAISKCLLCDDGRVVWKRTYALEPGFTDTIDTTETPD